MTVLTYNIAAERGFFQDFRKVQMTKKLQQNIDLAHMFFSTLSTKATAK